jgi:biotin synthase
MLGEIKRKIKKGEELTKRDALNLFSCDLQDLMSLACEVREEFRGNVITITSTIHIANICSKRCKYCGFSAYSSPEGYYKPFVKSEDDVLKLARCIERAGITRVSCSSAHGWGAYTVRMANLIKENTTLDVLINVGADLNEKILEVCKADTICCNLECINERIFRELKPDEKLEDRIEVCKMICSYGFELSSGLLIGIGESYADRVEHLFFLRNFSTLGEIPIMGFHPYKGTPMENYPKCSEEEQARTIAIARILYPELRITSPTPTLNPRIALLAGADNIATVIPDNYPSEVRGVGSPKYALLSEVLECIRELGLKAKVR